MEIEYKDNHIIFQFVDNWKAKSFALGANFATETTERLSVDVDYSILNTDIEFETIKQREFYISFHWGFWQLFVGFYI